MDRSTRLKQAIEQWRDGSIREFQRELQPRLKKRGIRGGSYAMIHRYLSSGNETQPSVSFLMEAAGLLGVRSEWLIDGRGAMTEAEAVPLGMAMETDIAGPVTAVLGSEKAKQRLKEKLGSFCEEPATMGLLYAAVQRLVAASPEGRAMPEDVAEAGELIHDLVVTPLKRLQGYSPEAAAGDSDYFVAALHAVMLAVPERGRGRPLSELISGASAD